MTAYGIYATDKEPETTWAGTVPAIHRVNDDLVRSEALYKLASDLLDEHPIPWEHIGYIQKLALKFQHQAEHPEECSCNPISGAPCNVCQLIYEYERVFELEIPY